MDISDTFEIYEILSADDGTFVCVKKLTTRYKGGDYDRYEDGSLKLHQDVVDINTISGDRDKYVLSKNIASAKFVENKIKKRQQILSKKGRDIKLKRQLHYLNLLKSNLISWFLDNDKKYPINLDNRPAFILAEGNSSATLNGICYALSVHQGAVIWVLYEAYKIGTPKLSGVEILMRSEIKLLTKDEREYIGSIRISDVFKSNKSAYKALIIKEGKSHYRLNLN